MGRRVFSVLAGAALIGGSLFLPRLAGFAGAADSDAGMCSGRTDAGFGISASAGGSGGTPVFALQVSSDSGAHVTGSMTFEGGAYFLSTQQWCRIWQHRPGDVPKGGEPYPEGAMGAHALGYVTLGDGTTVLVRADVRQLAGGEILYRVRYQPAGAHGETPVDAGTTTTAVSTTAATAITTVGPTTSSEGAATTAETTSTTQAPLVTSASGTSGSPSEGDEGAWTWVTPKGQWLPLDSMQLTGNVVYPSSTTTSTSTSTTTTSASTTSSTTSTAADSGTTTTAPPAAGSASTGGAAQEPVTVTVPATNTGMPFGANGWRQLSLAAGLAGLTLLLPRRRRPSLARDRRNGADQRRQA